ncbi:hypothetical protein ACLKA7_004834 [Drosophila subpalustris]
MEFEKLEWTPMEQTGSPAKIELAYDVLFPKKKKANKGKRKQQNQIELAYDVLFPKQKKSNTRKRNQQRLRNKNTNTKTNTNTNTITTNRCHRVWRKTIVLTKTKPKCKLPKLFRADRLTGLPVDYERTVSRIMHYVNPHLSSSPSPDQLMEQLLTRTLVSYVGNWKCGNRSPQFLKHHMRSILRDQAPQSLQENIRNDQDLGRFHCACKRKPVPAETLIPTYKSKFNYNNLKIKSK